MLTHLLDPDEPRRIPPEDVVWCSGCEETFDCNLSDMHNIYDAPYCDACFDELPMCEMCEERFDVEPIVYDRMDFCSTECIASFREAK